jgi:hypothetical protein
MGGVFDTFLFVDDEDDDVVTHNFGVGNGSTTDFQLQRTLVATADLPAPASRSYWPILGDGYEPIFDLNGSPSIFKDAVLQTITTHYTLPGKRDRPLRLGTSERRAAHLDWQLLQTVRV